MSRLVKFINLVVKKTKIKFNTVVTLITLKKMGQKINPVSLRLEYTNRHFDNGWYSGYFYKHLITKDLFIQQYLNNFLKLVKLPASRYSIQHLQKKTQVSSFLCYPKSTREWRSNLFGLTKKRGGLKKTRYFFKNKTEFKKISRKNTKSKLSFFYKTLNQVTIHKIQKKITSFQNFKLWSALIKTKKKSLAWRNKSSDFSWTYKSMKTSPKPVKKPILIKKINQLGAKYKMNVVPFFFKIEKNGTTPDNSNLLFLRNLFVYKTLKSQLKKKSLIPNNPLFNHKEWPLLSWRKTLNKTKTEVEKTSGTYSTVAKELSQVKPSFKTLDAKYKSYLESSLSSFYKLELNLIPFKVRNDWQYAGYLADELVYFLEKRIPFRRLKSKILKQLSKIPAIRGVRITCSGRVGGKSKKAQRAKTECIKYGQTSLQVFSSKLDFSVKTAFTSFGSVGVKVWICYNS